MDITAPIPNADRHITHARRLFAAPGFGAIFIGLAHTSVHLADLSGDRVRDQLAGRVIVEDYTAFDIWMGTSLLMGLFSIAMGSMALLALQAMPGTRPPQSMAIAFIMTLSVVATVGYLYMGPLQMYGAAAGIASMIGSIVAGRRADRASVVGGESLHRGTVDVGVAPVLG